MQLLELRVGRRTAIYIAFESAYRQFWELYVVEVPGGQPHLIPTFPGADNGATNWSRDGQWIYFFPTMSADRYNYGRFLSQVVRPSR